MYFALSHIVVVVAVVAVLLAVLFWFGGHANLKTPLMKDSCHGC